MQKTGEKEYEHCFTIIRRQKIQRKIPLPSRCRFDICFILSRRKNSKNTVCIKTVAGIVLYFSVELSLYFLKQTKFNGILLIVYNLYEQILICQRKSFFP